MWLEFPLSVASRRTLALLLLLLALPRSKAERACYMLYAQAVPECDSSVALNYQLETVDSHSDSE